jgi:phenylalanyl-tRNA synthetase alpha chain
LYLYFLKEVKKHLKKVDDFKTKDLSELESFRIEYSGKKGVLNNFFTSFRNISKEEKKRIWKRAKYSQKCCKQKNRTS